MKFCSRDCEACCDFCKHCIHDADEGGESTEPVGCSLHKDEEHQKKAKGCGFCDDFICKNVKDDSSAIVVEYDDYVGVGTYEFNV